MADYNFNFLDDGYVPEKPYDLPFRLFLKFEILPDNISNLMNIDIDSDTFLDSGFLYITMKNYFVVVDMENKVIRDLYSLYTGGRAKESLYYEEIDSSDVV